MMNERGLQTNKENPASKSSWFCLCIVCFILHMSVCLFSIRALVVLQRYGDQVLASKGFQHKWIKYKQVSGKGEQSKPKR